MRTTSVIVTDPTDKFRSQVAGNVGEGPAYVEAEGLGEVRRLLAERNGGPVVLVIGPGVSTEEALEFAEETQQTAPEVPVLLVARKPTAALFRKALRAGVRDVISTSCTKVEFREAVERAEEIASQLLAARPGPQGADGESGLGKIVTVFSTKGGCGKSVLASNLALLLAEESRVALVDMDLESGDCGIMLQLSPTRTIYEAALKVDTLDGESLKGHMTRYDDRLSLLAAPKEPGLSDKVTPEVVRRMLSLLRESFDYVVVDGPSFFTEQILAVLDETDECILIASLDVPSVKNLKIAIRTLELIGFKRDRLRLVLNRADSRVGLEVGEVEKALETKIEMLIPSSRDVPLFVNRGVPVVAGSAKSKAAVAMRVIAERLTGRDADVESAPPPRSWRRRLTG